MFLRSFFLAAPALAFVFAASSASAQEPAPAPATAPSTPADDFGKAGDFALSLNHGFTVNEGDLFSGANEIQASYFAAPHLSLGLAVGAQYASSSPPNGGDSEHTLILHVGPRVGYDVRLGDKVSFWPQVGIDYRRTEQSTSSGSVSSPGGGVITTTPSSTDTTSAFGVTVLAPIVFHPTNGFFVGAGPAFYTDLSSSRSSGDSSADQSKVTTIALVATIGGTF